MQLLTSLLLLLQINNAMASRDSLAFFYKPNKVSVLINELTPYGRLGDFMNQFTTEASFQREADGFKMSCSRTLRGAGCRFHFTPEDNILIQDRTLSAQFDLEAMEPTLNDSFVVNFASSANDKLRITIEDNTLIFEGSKILRQTH